MWKRVNMWAAQVEKKLASEILALWTLAQWLCSEPRLVFQGWLITDQLWRDPTCLGQRKQKHWLWMGRTWQIQISLFFWDKYHTGGFPGGSVVKDLPANAEDMGSIPRLGRSPGEGHGNPLQYSYLEIPWTEEPGGLLSMGLQRVRHDWATKHSTEQRDFISIH